MNRDKEVRTSFASWTAPGWKRTKDGLMVEIGEQDTLELECEIEQRRADAIRQSDKELIASIDSWLCVRHPRRQPASSFAVNVGLVAGVLICLITLAVLSYQLAEQLRSMPARENVRIVPVEKIVMVPSAPPNVTVTVGVPEKCTIIETDSRRWLECPR